MFTDRPRPRTASRYAVDSGCRRNCSSTTTHARPESGQLALNEPSCPAAGTLRCRAPHVEAGLPGTAGPLHTIKDHDAWLNQFKQHGWQVNDANEVTAVNHFGLPMVDQPVQVQTQFLTATTACLG